MTTLTVTLASICPGGNHLGFAITGAKSAYIAVDLSDLTAQITDQDADIFCKVVARMAKSGRTMAQAKTLLQSGVTVIV